MIGILPPHQSIKRCDMDIVCISIPMPSHALIDSHFVILNSETLVPCICDGMKGKSSRSVGKQFQGWYCTVLVVKKGIRLLYSTLPFFGMKEGGKIKEPQPLKELILKIIRKED